MPATDPLRILYKSLIGKGALPLEPTDPYYVSILEATPEKDPFLRSGNVLIWRNRKVSTC